MALTKTQIMTAQSPYHYTPADIHDVMVALSDPVAWDAFGTDRYRIVMQLLRAAQNLRVHIPFEFKEAVEDLIRRNGASLIGPNTERFN